MDNKEILKSLNKPLLPVKPITEFHKIFVKYTSHPYYKYAFDLLETLCNKTDYDNKKRLLHMAFTFLTIILYNCGNIPYISNFDIMILCCFNLSIKAIENQKNIPCLSKLKKIYKEKYINYQKEEIVKVEIICIKLLNYKINILTPYDCIYYLLKKENKEKDNNKYNLELVTKELEQQLIYNISENIDKKPLDIANEIIDKLSHKGNKSKYPKLLKRKIVPMFHHANAYKKKFYNKTDKYVNNTNNSYNKIQISNYMNNILHSNNNSPLNIHHNKYSGIMTHISKLKSNVYNHPISLILPYSENINFGYEKNKLKKGNTRNIILSSSSLINSFTNIDIELNNSPINRTNCESSSPCGSDGISSFIINNNSGVNLTKNSSTGNVFKKPCINKKDMKTFFRSDKKKNNENNKKPNINLCQEFLFDDMPQKFQAEKMGNNDFSNTFYIENENENNQEKKIVKVH